MSHRTRNLGRTCSCGKDITDDNVTGFCGPCNLRSPITEARRQAALRAKWENDPAWRAEVRARMKKVGTEAGRDPVLTARRREHGKIQYATYLNTPEVRAKVKATRPMVGKKIRDKKLAWCPPAYRDEYLFLLKNKKVRKAEAKEMILATIDLDKERRERARANLSPFERQELALQSGAQLAANDSTPSLSNPADFGEQKWA